MAEVFCGLSDLWVSDDEYHARYLNTASCFSLTVEDDGGKIFGEIIY
jgi:hypothetical protein